MPGIDYSRWDNLDGYSSSSSSGSGSGSDDENDQGARTTPRVTRLDAPSRVTFGGSGSQSVPVVQNAPKIVELSDDKSASMRHASSPANPDWTKHGGQLTLPDSDGAALLWSQDRYSVTLRFQILDDAKDLPSSRFRVEQNGILSYADRFHGVGSHKPLVRLYKAGRLWFADDFPHPVHFAQDDEDNRIEWIVERSADGITRYLTFTVHKAVPMHGMFLWWKRPFLQFDEIDPRPSEDGDGGRSKAFREAWEEAHRQFRQKERPKPSEI